MRTGIHGTSWNPHPESGDMLALWSLENPALQVALVGYGARMALSQAVPVRPLPHTVLRLPHLRTRRSADAHRPSRNDSGRARACAGAQNSPPDAGKGQGDRQDSLADRLAKRLGPAAGRGTGIPGCATRQSAQTKLDRGSTSELPAPSIRSSCPLHSAEPEPAWVPRSRRIAGRTSTLPEAWCGPW
jgi:hypothetical protein